MWNKFYVLIKAELTHPLNQCHFVLCRQTHNSITCPSAFNFKQALIHASNIISLAKKYYLQRRGLIGNVHSNQPLQPLQAWPRAPSPFAAKKNEQQWLK
jgi:hypothetical protein